MESWYTKLFSMTLVKVKMHLEGLNGWNEIVKPKKLKVIVWQRKLESHLTFFSKPNKTCNYQYCKWWLYIISNQPQQPAVQINLILATHFGDGTDLRRSPHLCFNLQEGGEEDEDVDASPRFLSRQIFNFVVALNFKVGAVFFLWDQSQYTWYTVQLHRTWEIVKSRCNQKWWIVL